MPTLAAWQEKYDDGSRLLAADDDAKISDDDPSAAFSTNAASVYRNDDVPMYVEFVLTNGPTNLCVFTKTLLPVISNNSNATFHVRFAADLNVLHSAPGNIKLVKNMILNLTNVVIANIGSIGQKPPSFVVSAGADAAVLIHEWGHSCGIQHRGWVINGTVPNPANVDLHAVMESEFISGFEPNKINRAERDLMNAY